MVPLRLNWTCPTNGVEEEDGRFQVRGDDTHPIHYQSVDLSAPVVLAFLNMNREGKLPQFLSSHGFLDQGLRPEIEEVKREAAYLWTMLVSSLNANDRRRRINDLLEHVAVVPAFENVDGADRLVLRPRRLLDYMVLEVASAFEAGASVTTCEHCGKAFLVGSLTGRRSTATYCSTRCRVGAQRARQAQA